MINIICVSLGAIFFIVSLFNFWQIYNLPLSRNYKAWWWVLISFIFFFLGGYVAFIVALLKGPMFFSLATLVSQVFLWGAVFVLLVSTFFARLMKGQITFVEDAIRTMKNADELIKTEAALRESEEKYKFLVDNIREIALVLDKIGRILFANTAALQTFGYAENEVLGKSIADFLEKGSLKKAFWALAQEFLGQHHGEFEVEAKNKQGEIRTLLITGSTNPVRKNGEVIGVLVNGRDVTEQKRAEAALLASEQKLRRFYDSGLLGVIYWNMDGKIIDANDKFLQMVGYTRAELIAGQIDWGRMTPPEYRYLDERSVAELKATGVNKEPFEKEYFRQDGTRLPIIIAGAMLDEERFNGIAFVLDITARKLAEAELAEREALLRITIDDAPVSVAMVGLDKRFQKCNKAFVDFLGYSEEELKQKFIADITFPEDVEIGIAEMGAILAGEKQKALVRKRYGRKDGGVVWGEVNINIIRDTQNKPVYFLAVIQDITDRKRAEEKISALANEWQQTFDATGDLITYLDKDNNVLRANKAMTDFLGRSQQDVVGQKCYALMHGTERSIPNCPLDRSRVAKKRETAELYLKEKGLWIMVTTDPVLDDKGEIVNYVHIIRDITENKRAALEMQKKLDELQIFYKAAMDREDKILELKNKVEELEKHG
jgi:PAS domain S-box-containing protein